MKKSLLLLVIVTLLTFVEKSNAQIFPSTATRDLKKDIKRLTKDGWMPCPAALPLRTQHNAKQKYGDTKLYLTGTGSSYSKIPDVGRSHAYHKAIQEIVQNIHKEVMGLVNTMSNNEAWDAKDIATLSKDVEASVTSYGRKISGTIIIYQIYRKLDTGNFETVIEVAIDKNAAMQEIENDIKDRLLREGNKLTEKVNEMFLKK